MAGIFACVAALPPLVRVLTELGVVPRAWAVLFGVHHALPPLLLAGTPVDILAWAWAVFFIVVAIIAASPSPRDNRPRRVMEEEDYVLGGPNMQASGGYGKDGDRPKAVGRDSPPGAQATGPGQGGDNLPVGADMAAAVSWYNKGFGLAGMGRHEEAVRCFDEALDLDPRSVAAWHNKGKSLCALGRYGEAIRCFNEALVLDRGNAELWRSKGDALTSVGQAEDARRCYNKALELSPPRAGAQE